MGFSIELIDGIVQANNNTFKLAKAKDIDFTQATAITGSNLADGDLFICSDINEDVSTNANADVKKITASNLKSYLQSGTLPVSSGGTGASSFADKSVIITQDSGTDTLAAVTMSVNGKLLIGGTSGPAAATLTAGQNINITNADNQITISAVDRAFINSNTMSGASTSNIASAQSIKTYVDNEVAGVVDSAPGALNTLNELAAALNDDANFSTTITNSIASKAPTDGPVFTGIIAIPNIANIETAIADNTSKNTNVTTNLSVTTSSTTIDVVSSDGDNATLPVATSSAGGVLSAALFNQINTNASKNTNVSTDLSVANSTDARVIASSDGTNATIPVATTSVSGVMSTTIFDQHTVNVNKNTNATHTGDVTGSGALTIGNDKVTYAKMQNVTNARILGNNAGSDGDVTEMTKDNVLSFINVTDGATPDQTDVTGSSGSCTGNAVTATSLAASINIGGVSFNGAADIDLPGVNSAGNQNTSGTAANATNAAHVFITDNESTNEQNQITFIENAGGGGGNRGLEADGDLTYNPSTGTLSASKVSSTEFNTSYGGVHSSGSGSERALRLTSVNHVEVYLDSDQSSSANTSIFRIINGSGNTVWGVDETGNIVKDNPKIKKIDGTVLQEFESDGTLNASTFRASGNSPGKFLGPTNDELSVESVDHLTFKIASGGASSKSFKFVNNTTEVASINSSGDLQIDGTFLSGDVTSSGNTATMAAVQTNITTITNAALKIGRDADNLIEFDLDNIIDFRVGAGNVVRLSMNQFRPSQNNVMNLGFGTIAFKNLFLGSGATINFNNADVVLTHSANLLTITGGNVDIVGTLDTDNLTISGAQGTDGQVLTSTGSGVAWEDAPSGGGGGGGTNTNIANTNLTLNAGRSLNLDDNNLEIKNGTTSYLNFDDAGINILVASDDLDIGAFNFRAKSFTSDVATGTAPFVVSSTTAVANLQSSTTASIGNLTGEVTSTNRATVIADNVVDEANLKVSNAPTNGYVLTAQSGNTGGLTWAAQSGGGGGSSSTSHREIVNCGFNDTSTTKGLFPFGSAGIFDVSASSSLQEYSVIVAPYDGYVEYVILRCTGAAGTTAITFHKRAAGTAGVAATGNHSVNVSVSANTAVKAVFGSTNGAFSAGDIIATGYDAGSVGLGDAIASMSIVYDLDTLM